ncbi:CobW family GTP-binding protein [Brachybacterium hainanense]|uniref:CobW family GTP-binding protein n=1 Tax=Brachybacterium hainanense TaxID=1541174 RepID=A0ABV6R8E0_9MICO
MPVSPSAPAVPVIALTGFLGAGKTTVLNSLLRAPGARLGVVVNDFGAINVDAALVTGQVDEAASIAGGCLCCLPDHGGLDEALETLSDPRLRLDAILVEASGAAEPLAVARLIRFTSAGRTRPGGVIEVIDAIEHLRTVDPPGTDGRHGPPPPRYGAASLAVITKTARLPVQERAARVTTLTRRLREENSALPVLEAPHGSIDPALVLDVAGPEDPEGELPLAAVTRAAREEAHPIDHQHARAVTVPAAGPVDPGRVLDLFEDPPHGVYRMKGVISVETGRTRRRFVMNLVGRHAHVAPPPAGAAGIEDGLVAIGPHLDADGVRDRLRDALAAPTGPIGRGMRRLLRYRRLSE